MNQTDFVQRLKQHLLIEHQRQDRNGVYGYTQRSMAYNSNRIEGSTLTKRQTASIFETGTVFAEEDYPIRTKDIEELNGHFKMFNYMLHHINEPLSEDIIKNMHKNLKEGVFEDIANGYAIGDYKRKANYVGSITTTLPQEVPIQMKNLLEEYHQKSNISIKDIAELHAKFENIHPFQDGNGRVGRMIILKECLMHNLIPVIIRDNNKPIYMHHLHDAQVNHDYSGLVKYFQAEQNHYVEKTKDLIYDYEESNRFDALDTKYQELSQETETLNTDNYEY